MLVSAADKLYNVRVIVEDFRSHGAEVWARFNRGPEQQLWYYGEILKVFQQRCPDWRIVTELGWGAPSALQDFRGEAMNLGFGSVPA